MLVFSNAVIGYASLFRNKVTGWLLTLPVDHRAVFGYRIIETMAFSSWGLVFLSAPLLLAFGRLHGAPLAFYIKALALYLPFLIIPAGTAALVMPLVVRYLNRFWVAGATVLAVAAVARTLFSAAGDATSGPGTGLSVTLTFESILNHTKISTNPFIPSTWIGDAILVWSRGTEGNATFHALLLLSYALMAGLLTMTLFSRGYYATWVRSFERRAALSSGGGGRFRRRGSPPALARAFSTGRPPGWSPSRLVPRQIRALVRKDVLTFRREPSQWAQVSVIVSLLLIYVLNLRNIGYGDDSPFWTIVISYLNLVVCSLALSTLTTRFIFPQFSLEGRRLWIVGVVPFRMEKMVLQKFWLGLSVTATITLGLMGLSGVMLDLPNVRNLYFMGAVGMMSFALTALAVGTGTLFPNLRESNPAKIVSGFGGTLCLILSFVYIVLAVTCLVVPEANDIRKIKNLVLDEGESYTLPIRPAGLVAATALSTLFGLPPLILAYRRVKSLDFFGKL